MSNLFQEDIHAEVEEVLNKNVITDEDIKKYKMNHDTSLTAGEFLELINSALKEDAQTDSSVPD